MTSTTVPIADRPQGRAKGSLQRTALISVGAAIFQVVVKLVTGILTGSLAFVAEAAHSATDLVAALRRVLRGERVSDPRMVPGNVGNQAALARSGLTRHEYEVLRLAAQGRTNPEIAEATGLARNTVKTYLQSALHKLGARNRVEAIGKASEAGLL